MQPLGGAEAIPIDEGMTILVGLLWQLEFATNACCQNIGGYLLHRCEVEEASGNDEMARHLRREAQYAMGMCSLSMPVADACTFLDLMAYVGDEDLARRVWEPSASGAWKKFIPLIPHEPNGGFAQETTGPFRPDTTAQIRFPLGDAQKIEQVLMKLRRESYFKDMPYTKA